MDSLGITTADGFFGNPLARSVTPHVPTADPDAVAERKRMQPASPRTPMASPPAPALLTRILRMLLKNTRGVILDVLYGTGGGIDDTAMPSGYMAPHKKGSRGVRNLWHQPF